MSFRFKLLSWIVAINLCITGLLMWAVLSNIHTQSTGFRRNAERFAEQREEIIRRLEDILAFQERVSHEKLRDVSAGTILQWDEWNRYRDAVVRLDYMEQDGEIVPVNILLNPLGRHPRGFNDEQGLAILDAAIRDDRLVLREDDRNPDNFHIAIPIHVGTGVLGTEGRGSGMQGRVWGGALVQPRFPTLESPGEYFDWNLFWVAMVGGTCILILVTYFMLSRMVIRPVEMMAHISDRVAGGDFTLQCSPIRSQDEIGKLVSSFNYMLNEVGDYHQHLEDRVKEAQEKVRAAEQHLVIAQRLASTGKLAAGIAHEINNPIGGMINAALNLKERTGKEKEAERTHVYLDLIVEGLGRIKDIVRKVLIFTPRSLTPESVSLLVILRDALHLVDYRLEKEEIRVDLEVRPEELKVFCEAGELRQVFLNLIINALDAVERGIGRIRLTGRVMEDTRKVCIEIEDNGSGMNSDELARAFDLFYTTKEAGKGTGLGLSVAHNIVANHGGSMEAESEEGRGTVIRVILPARQGKE